MVKRIEICLNKSATRMIPELRDLSYEERLI